MIDLCDTNGTSNLMKEFQPFPSSLVELFIEPSLVRPLTTSLHSPYRTQDRPNPSALLHTYSSIFES
jgi:hypothetical protein